MNKTITVSFLLLGCVCLSCIGCTKGWPGDQQVFKSISDVPDHSWKKLSEKRIFFGHKSVGSDIINGLHDLNKQYPQIKLHIVTLSDFKGGTGGVFISSKIGQNRNTASKLDAFSKELSSGLGKEIDIAMMKFCYVDFMKDTDTKLLFSQYQNTIKTLQERFPNIKFVHVTAPIESRESGIKYWLKRILGKPVRDAQCNLVREKYNQLIRKFYEGSEPIFDLALFESTLPDGVQNHFKERGEQIIELVPSYTYDGGHLNERGRKLIAAKFILTLIEAIK